MHTKSLELAPLLIFEILKRWFVNVLAQSSIDATLCGHRMRPRRKELAYARSVEASFGKTESGSQSCTTGANNDCIVFYEVMSIPNRPITTSVDHAMRPRATTLLSGDKQLTMVYNRVF